MTQSTDLLLSDQAGASFRSELNSIIAAIASSHKGGSSPSYAVTGMVWLDDTSSPWVIKQFDGTDWITLGKLDPTANKFKLSNSADATDLAEVPTLGQIQNSSGVYGVTTGAAGSYVLDLGAGLRPTAYVAGQEFRVKVNHLNPGPCTIEVVGAAGSLGAKDIKLPNGNDPGPGQLAANSQVILRYDGTNMVLLSLPALITLPMMATGTAGKVVGYDSLGNPTELTIDRGSPIVSVSITGSPQTVEFADIFREGYNYDFILSNVIPSGNARLYAQFGSSGTSWLTSNYAGYAEDADAVSSSTGLSVMELTPAQLPSGSVHGCSGRVYVENPMGSSDYKKIYSLIARRRTSVAQILLSTSAWGYMANSAGKASFRFDLESTTTFVSGNIAVYERPMS